jgi:hypothetical protein
MLESRCRCVSCAPAKAEGGRPLCVGASYRGNARLCFTHSVMRTLAARICNVVATPDYSRPQCNLNLYNFNMTKKGKIKPVSHFLRSAVTPQACTVYFHYTEKTPRAMRRRFVHIRYGTTGTAYVTVYMDWAPTTKTQHRDCSLSPTRTAYAAYPRMLVEATVAILHCNVLGTSILYEQLLSLRVPVHEVITTCGQCYPE